MLCILVMKRLAEMSIESEEFCIREVVWEVLIEFLFFILFLVPLLWAFIVLR